MRVENGVLTITDDNTGKTYQLRHHEGFIECRPANGDDDDWDRWSYESVFHQVNAWFSEVVVNA